MKTRWFGPMLLVGAGAAAAFVLTPRKAPVEHVTADPSVVAPVVEPEPEPLATEAALKAPIPREVHRPRRHDSAERLKPDTMDPWSDRDLAPVIALAELERPHLEVDHADPWDGRRLDPAQPGAAPPLDRDPWASGADPSPKVASVQLAKHEKQTLDPWTNPL